jgi:hypothetical protein
MFSAYLTAMGFISQGKGYVRFVSNILIHCLISDKYNKAVKRSKLAEDTSNLESSESETDKENDQPNKRLRKSIDYAEEEGTLSFRR